MPVGARLVREDARQGAGPGGRRDRHRPRGRGRGEREGRRARAASSPRWRAQAWADATVSVRVNAPRTPWCHLDIAALAALPEQPAAIVVPKVESAGDLAFVERLLDGVEAAAGRARPLRVQALIETAAGLSRVQEIAARVAAARRADPRLRRPRRPRSAAPAPARDDSTRGARPRSSVLLAARAHGLQAIDGPYLGIAVDDAFTAAVARARDLGLRRQVGDPPGAGRGAQRRRSRRPTRRSRAPRRDRRARAGRARGGAGAVALDGQMLDEAVRRGRAAHARARRRGRVTATSRR